MLEAVRRFVTKMRSRGRDAPAPTGADAHVAAQACCDEGARHLAAGRLTEAERALGRALELRRDYPEALLLQGIVCKEQGRLDDARDSLLLAEHFQPGLAEASFQLGLIAAKAGSAVEAEACFRKAVTADARHARAHNALGAVLFQSGSLQAARECFQRAVELDPLYAQAHSNLGCLLVTRLDRWEEGAGHIETAWRLEPGNMDVMLNWALLLQQRGRLDEALPLWTRLVDSGTDVEKARLNRAMVFLKQGDFERGWADYESRKRTESEYVPRNFPFPEWDGETLAGRTILVHAEQGIGDQIMFASCIPDLVKIAGHCVVECTGKLEKLFGRSFPAVTVVAAQETASVPRWLAQVPPIDCQVAAGSLPRVFRGSAARFPRHDGYLRADPGRVAEWRRRLDALNGALKVGVSWRGGTRQSRQSLRSISLDEWLPVLRQEGVAWVSLQYTDCRDELAGLERDHGLRLFHSQEAIDDYDETAALVCALDLVVSVQTSLIHLAGALGRPVWVLVPAIPEWRYMASGETMPWYPSARLYRQPEAGQWPAVFERVAADLRKRAGG